MTREEYQDMLELVIAIDNGELDATQEELEELRRQLREHYDKLLQKGY